MQKKIIFFIFGFLPLLLLAQKKSPKKVNNNAVATIPSIQAPLKLWYDNPAKYFEEALLLGNGTQGATVFGGISIDKIFLNDLTLCSGKCL